MKTLINSLIKNKKQVVDPIAWIKELSSLDDIHALKKSTQHLSDILSDDNTTDETVFKVTLIADQENRARIHNLTKQYTQTDHLREDLANNIHEAVYFYCRQLSHCYRKLMSAYINAEKSAPPFDSKQFPLVLGRAMLANMTMSKWRHYQQLPASDFAWQELYAVYHLAESHGYAKASIQLYRDEIETNLTNALISACMLGSLDHAMMTKHDIEVVSTLLMLWGKSLHLNPEYHAKKHLFYIDYQEDRPARRIRLLDESDSNRYWELDFIVAKLELAIFHAENNQLDKFLEMQNVSQYPQLVNVLQMLKSAWSRHDYQRQRRVEERKKVTKTAVLFFGIDNICKKFKQTHLNIADNRISENSLEDRLMHNRWPAKNMPNQLFEDTMLKKWWVSNESKSGYGITLNDSLPSDVILGKLVGMIIDGDKSKMTLAVIKSIKNINNEHQIGLKVLSKKAILAELTLVSGPGGVSHQSYSDFNLAFNGLYIDTEEGLAMWPSIVLPKLQFQENALYQVNIHHQKVNVRLGKPNEAKDDWVRINWPE